MRKVLGSLGSAVLIAASPAYAQDAEPPGITPPQIETEVALLGDERFGGLRRPRDVEAPLPEDALTVEATIGIVSDFRRAGLSYTNGKAALQGEVLVEHKSGFFASLFASNVANNGGANVELDIGLGYGFSAGPLEAQIGIIDYVTPGVTNSNYYELQAGVSKKFGASELAVAVSYSPPQDNIGGQDNLYIGASAEVPLKFAPLTINAAAGVEDGAFGDRKIDWSLGGIYAVDRFDLGLTYVDSARTFGEPNFGPKLVFSLSSTF
jgi:uncharacterized protein (TIGR02001 family)